MCACVYICLQNTDLTKFPSHKQTTTTTTEFVILDTTDCHNPTCLLAVMVDSFPLGMFTAVLEAVSLASTSWDTEEYTVLPRPLDRDRSDPE